MGDSCADDTASAAADPPSLPRVAVERNSRPVLHKGNERASFLEWSTYKPTEPLTKSLSHRRLGSLGSRQLIVRAAAPREQEVNAKEFQVESTIDPGRFSRPGSDRMCRRSRNWRPGW